MGDTRSLSSSSTEPIILQAGTVATTTLSTVVAHKHHFCFVVVFYA